MKCKYCGGERFTAHQLVRMDVIVDGDGEWVQNLHEDDFAQNIYDSERPYGPFQCCGCGAEYDELSEGEEPYSGPVEGWKRVSEGESADNTAYGCFPCACKTCVFNPEGTCKYALLYGEPPASKPDGGCGSYVFNTMPFKFHVNKEE